jgi:putative glutamine amidotransferase
MSPIIGITQATFIHHPQSMRDRLADIAYFSAIRQAGGIPLRLSHFLADTLFSSNKIHLDGLLFSGGGDINPRIYGSGANRFIDGVDDQRDTFELALFNLAVKKEIPFLGICRGCQLVNVVLGGSLYRDLDQERPDTDNHDWHPSRQYPAHSVVIESACRFNMIAHSAHFKINSLHHQGIKQIGEGLKPFAYAEDGLVEGIELTGHRFGLAVQWHPEWLTDQQSTHDLFNGFIAACEHSMRIHRGSDGFQ